VCAAQHILVVVTITSSTVLLFATWDSIRPTEHDETKRMLQRGRKQARTFLEINEDNFTLILKGKPLRHMQCTQDERGNDLHKSNKRAAGVVV
jgi:hypothetical protein